MNDLRSELIQDYANAIIKPVLCFSEKDYLRTSKRYRKIYSNFLPSQKNARILDVGCGDGYFLYFLNRSGFAETEGIDASEERLVFCRKYVTDRVYNEEATAWLKKKISTYDMITCHHVIEHFPDNLLLDFAMSLQKALRPTGKLILTTPNACSPWAGYNLFHDLTHCRLFTTDSLAQLLMRAGFSSVSFYPEASTPFDLPSTLRWFAWKVRELQLKIQFRIEMGGIRGGQKTPLIVSPNLIALAENNGK